MSTTPTCSFSQCKNVAKSKGLCHGHYAQQRRGRPLTPLGEYGKVSKVCTFSECDFEAVTKDLCDRHYRQSKAGKPLTEIKRRGDYTTGGGSRYINGQGYV